MVLKGVLKLLLASLVYNGDYLKANIRGRATKNPLFYRLNKKCYLDELKPFVHLCYDWDRENDHTRAKGCAPQHQTMMQLEKLRVSLQDVSKKTEQGIHEVHRRQSETEEMIKNLQDTIAHLPNVIAESVGGKIEAIARTEAFRKGTVTQEQVRAEVEAYHEATSHKFEEIKKMLLDHREANETIHSRVHNGEQAEPPKKTFEDYYVKTNGNLQRLRPSFRLPQVSVREAMFMWYIGGYYGQNCLTEEEKQAGVRIPHPPLKILNSREFHALDKYSLCKWRKVIHAIIDAANIPGEDLSLPYIQKLFDAGKHCVSNGDEDYTYTIEQSSNTVLTAYNKLRKQK